MCRREHEGKVVRFPKSYLTKSSGFYNITKRNLNFQPQKYAMQIKKKIDLIQTNFFQIRINFRLLF